MSHTCARCGSELARERAIREPVYGFMLVVCPSCGEPCVRRRHVLRPLWRRHRGRVRSISMLLLQLVCGFLLLLATAGPAREIGSLLNLPHVVAAIREDSLSNVAAHLLSEGQMLIIFVLAITMSTGIWLSTALGHFRKRHVFAGWMVALVVAVSIPLLVWPLRAIPCWLGGADVPAFPSVRMWLAAVGVVSLAALGALPGMVVGVVISDIVLRQLKRLQTVQVRRQRHRRSA